MENRNEEVEQLLGNSDLEPIARGSLKWRKRSLLYTITVHLLLVAALLGNLYQYTRATAHSQRLTNCKIIQIQSHGTYVISNNFLIVPGLRSLRTVVRKEHPEHGVANSAFDGPPSNATATAWTQLLQRAGSSNSRRN